MAARVEFLPEAIREVEEALDWYLERSTRAAGGFLRELEWGVSLVAESPNLWPAFQAGTRRHVLRKFPFNLIFRELDDGIEIVALAHHSRRPRYWIGR